MYAKCVIVALCAIIGFAIAGEHMQAFSQKCLDKMELEKSAFEEFFQKRPVETDDPKIKCYFKCLLQEIKWMDEHGNINDKPEVPVGEQFEAHGMECKDVMGGDDCEKAFNFHKCLITKKEEQQ